jgi:hypothetical protein
MVMDIQSLKIELTKLILDIDNPALIEKIKDLLLKETGDFWSTLSEDQKEELKFGIHQLNEGKRISFDEFLKKVQ